MEHETSQLTLKLETYFWLLDNSKRAWQILKGQRIRHVNYGYGTIDDVQDDCVWIKFDTPDESREERSYFPKRGFLKGQFTELQLFGAALEQPSIKSYVFRLRRQQEHELERILLERERIRVEQEMKKERIRQEQEAERTERERWLKAQKEKEDREQLVKEIEARLESDFLSVDLFYDQHPQKALLGTTTFQKLKVQFVQDWTRKTLDFLVDEEQAAAISATTGDIQVIARAGSGKTRTLVTRAIFLQEHCHVSPDELLLLAFNTKAVKEIQKRLENILGRQPHIMTFHALAYALVHPDEELIYDDISISQLILSKEIQEVIDEHIRSPRHHHLIRDIMLMHFREDWERIIEDKQHLSLDERRKLPHESLNGDFVKSFGEKLIANTLFENSVEYKYERNYHWNDSNYRPDFTILLGKNKGIVIEYFGLQGDRDYDELSERKRDFWKAKEDWNFLEYSPDDIARLDVDGFKRRLLYDIGRLGIPTRKRTDEEIWDLIYQRAVDRFTRAIRTFVSRCRKFNLSEVELEKKVQTHLVSSPGEKAFLNAAIAIYRGYLEKLEVRHKEDFDGLMWRAIELVNDGLTRFARNKGQERGDLKKLKFILIDEFQDFSQMFYQLSMAIRSQNCHAQFFCVGDDWQAINEFAGSELTFFLNFSNHFMQTSTYYISRNYRSPSPIVEVGNALMHGFGKPALPAKTNPGDVLLCPLDKLKLTAIEQSIHNGDEITPAILRLIKRYLSLGRNIVLLSRRNGLPWFVNYTTKRSIASDDLQIFRDHLLKFLPEEDHKLVQISTTHKYKGEEDSIIIIVDAVERSYPLIHPNWIFLRAFGESIENIESAERRLFYVALTRPRESLLIVTESNQKSPYLKDIEAHLTLKQIDWNKHSPPASLNGEHVEVRVKNAYDVKEDLKRLGFRWNAKGGYWYRAFLREGFVFEDLLQQGWVNQRLEIKVYSEMQELINEHVPRNDNR